MKRILSFALTLAMAAALAACGQSAPTPAAESAAAESTAQPAAQSVSGEAAAGETQAQTPETIVIQSLDANKELTDLEVPYDPQRIAILDMAALDILDALGVGDRVCIEGRLQSREYRKKLEDGSAATHRAFEVSILKLSDDVEAEEDMW